MKLNLKQRNDNFQSPHESFQKELRKEETKDRMNMAILKDQASAWVPICKNIQNFSDECLEEYKALTNEILHLYWGESAWCEFNVSKMSISCHHEDGRMIVL
jgi:hypothetical protein